jgi:hypothetical protein
MTVLGSTWIHHAQHAHRIIENVACSVGGDTRFTEYHPFKIAPHPPYKSIADYGAIRESSSVESRRHLLAWLVKDMLVLTFSMHGHLFSA